MAEESESLGEGDEDEMSIEASECYVDWKQAELNGFSYCFHRMDGGLCGRSDSWAGHRETDSSVYHPFVKISTVFAQLNAAVWARDKIAEHAVRLEAEVRELRKAVSGLVAIVQCKDERIAELEARTR